MNGASQFVSPSERDELQNYTLRLVPNYNINVLCILIQLIVKQMLGLELKFVEHLYEKIQL